jgi:hypothetical protein
MFPAWASPRGKISKSAVFGAPLRSATQVYRHGKVLWNKARLINPEKETNSRAARIGG